MDLWICGIIDIVLVVFGIVFLVLGYKKGFIKKVVSFFGIFAILIFSFMYCGQLANFLTENQLISPSIYENIHTNLVAKIAEADLTTATTVEEFLKQTLSIPGFIATMIQNGIKGAGIDVSTVGECIDGVSLYITNVAMSVICFLILAIGIFILLLLLKLIANLLRTNGIVRFIDGVLGAMLSLTIFLVVVCVAFYVLSLCMDAEWFASAKEWLTVDMKLGQDSFRISKVIYEGNIIQKIMNLFF